MKNQQDSTLKQIDRFQFSLKDSIGQGSFGKVYKGKDKKNSQLVAVKMMDKKKIQSDEYLMQGLFSEIQVMKKLQSPYIVELIEVLETSNNYYIIQEFCDGGDFRHILKKRQFLPESEAINVLKDLLGGFTELLKQGVIHRDLKPENILKSEDKYKLADFGFARTVDNFKKQMLESLVGTPLYMAPQILKHENYSTKSDIWSLALIYYEMLYGQTPWMARSQYELVQKIEKEPVQFKDQVQKVSEQSKDFIRRCLEIKEDKRISWEEIYNHELFGEHFKEFLKTNKELENKANFIINNLRQKILQEQIDLEELFKKYKYSDSTVLTIKEFQKMMHEIDNQLERVQIEYLFNNLDTNQDQKIDFEEFRLWLERNDVKMSIRGSAKQQIPRFETKHATPQQQNLAKKTIQQVQLIIQEHNVNKSQLYHKFKDPQQDYITLDGLEKILKKLSISLSAEDLKVTYSFFDVDGDGRLTFNDLQEALQKYSVSGNSGSDYSTGGSSHQGTNPIANLNYQSNNIQNLNQFQSQMNMQNLTPEQQQQLYQQYVFQQQQQQMFQQQLFSQMQQQQQNQKK